MALITVKNLSFTYPGTEQAALSDLSLTIERGAFVTLMGATGSGKSTFLRLLKPQLRQNGILSGEILFDDADIDSLSAKDSAARIGYVAQNPEEQIVTDKVWHELAFTLENLGAKRSQIARRIAEISSFFGIDDWYERNTATLSGGQKQLLNLASVMTADPDILLLDEPTAQLDPIAAATFLEAVCRLHRETGLTVVICEHRAEELFPISDRVIILENGKIIYDNSPRQVAEAIAAADPHLCFLPTPARIAKAVKCREIPLTIREGQRLIANVSDSIKQVSEAPRFQNAEIALELKNIFFRYDRQSPDILSDFTLSVLCGEVFALLGANGAGKSTAAAVAAGLRTPYSGSVRLFGKRMKDYKNGSLYQNCLSLLPQDIESVFIRETVGEELKGCEAAVEKLPYDLSSLYDRHPYDLSGGERQLVALCKVLSAEPRFLIMDEPSKGLDPNVKTLLCDIISRLKAQGVTILLITHDVEFAAACADRCALFSHGRIAACDPVADFLFDNRFYTTAASRVTRGRFHDAYTVDHAVRLIELNGGAR